MATQPFEAGSTEKYIRNGAVWLDVGEPTERLAGATITLMDGIRNVINWGPSIEDALTMATLTPAQNLGVAESIGSIATGKIADVVIVDDNFKRSNGYFTWKTAGKLEKFV